MSMKYRGRKLQHRKDLDWRLAVKATNYIVNPDQSRFIRIMWVNVNPEWHLLTPLEIATRAIAINNDTEHLALMVDNTTICLS